METIFLSTENSKTNEPHKFVLSLPQRLDLKNSDIYVALHNLRQQYKKIKLKIIAPTWNDEFELPDGSYSVLGIQNYIEYIKKHETLADNPPIHIYMDRVNNRLVFKIKDGYKLELPTLETMKLFGSTKNLIDKERMEKMY